MYKWSFPIGETPFSCEYVFSMKADLGNGESYLLTSDTMFFKENWVDEQPPGWLVRNMGDWYKSLDRLKRIAARDNCHVILGHDKEIFQEHAKKGVIG